MDVNNIQFTVIELRISKFLYKHYQDRYNSRQLAKSLEINHAHTNKLCLLLTKKNLLIREDIGNAIFYSYNFKNKNAQKFMEYLLSMEEKKFPEWLAVISYSLNKFSPYIELGIVFGSAIKTKNYNDIDVMLMYTTQYTTQIQKIKDEIRKSGLVEKPIRYVEITKDDIMLNKDNKTFYSMISNCLIFHGSEKFAEVIRKCRK